jgi:hypothetical protein
MSCHLRASTSAVLDGCDPFEFTKSSLALQGA